MVPIGFTNNVTQLHQALFADSLYQPSENVLKINDEIIYLTGVTEDTDAVETTFDGDVHDEESQ